VLAHHGVLLVGEQAGLVEDAARHAQLADVVEQPAVMELLVDPGREAHLAGDLDAERGDAFRVPHRPRGLGVDGAGQRLERAEVQGLELAELPLHLGGHQVERCAERFELVAARDFDPRREVAPAAPGRHVAEPIERLERSPDLTQAHPGDARQRQFSRRSCTPRHTPGDTPGVIGGRRARVSWVPVRRPARP
jgi:hypothetical protein